MQRPNSYDFYRILGIDATASAEAIEQAFLSLSAKISPELQTADNPTYQRLVQAHQILGDAKRRAAYDAFLRSQTAPVLTMETKVSNRKVPLLDTAQIVYLFVNIYPPAQQKKVHVPLNLALVIDRSTSMQGIRLERVKAAVNLILDQLAPEDVLSVISFSDRAEIILPPGNIGENKSGLLSKIRRMQASGGTEIFQGLQSGVTQLSQMTLADYTNHLILLTDGHTYGDADKCLELSEKMAAQGIGLSAFGLGSEWNDEFLDELVSPSGGRSDYIEKPTQIIEFLQHHINGLGDVYARHVSLQLNLPKPMILQYGFKLTPFSQPIFAENRVFKLGNIEGRAPLKILLELNLQPQREETKLNISLKLMAEIPSQKQSAYTSEKKIQLEVEPEPPEVEPPAELVKAVRVLNLYRLNEKVRNEVEVGELEAATKRMKHLTTRLLEVGETQLAQHAHTEMVRLEKMGDLSEEGRKRLKYGTRSLFSGLLQDLDLDQ